MKKRVRLGGQAVIEGVMIKSPSHVVISVRTPDGMIKTKKTRYVSAMKKYSFLKVPIIRGVVSLYELLITGVKAISWSANQQGEGEKVGFFGMFLTFVLATVLTIALFVLIPYRIAEFVATPPTVLFNLIDGGVRLAIFFIYILLIGLMKDVRVMFQYHGAEHMAVNCYESGKPLTVKNARKFSTIHARCGTSLLVLVFAISIVIFSLVRTPVWYANIAGRIVLIPVIAGVSYELLKLSAKYKKNIFFKILIKPGLWFQKMTTRVPTLKQLEVGLAAVKNAQK